MIFFLKGYGSKPQHCGEHPKSPFEIDNFRVFEGGNHPSKGYLKSLFQKPGGEFRWADVRKVVE